VQVKIKTTLITVAFIAVTFVAPEAFADIETLEIQWSGAQYNNSAVATGFITFDSTIFPQTGTSGFVSLPDSSIIDLGITIIGASSGNGVFSLVDFYGVSFTTPGPLD
jgi:hypothetical protein